MRVTVTVDSATPEQVYDLTLAFQRTKRDHALPEQLTTEPTVTAMGKGMGWTSPALRPGHDRALLAEYAALQEARS